MKCANDMAPIAFPCISCILNYCDVTNVILENWNNLVSHLRGAASRIWNTKVTHCCYPVLSLDKTLQDVARTWNG